MPFKNVDRTSEGYISYKKGGFHPMQIGDRFDDNRYEVIRKLGYGSFSTVWLAKDAKYCSMIHIHGSS